MTARIVGRLFPPVIDNRYRGITAALWLLGIVAIVKMMMGGNVVLNGAFVITTADGVPLSTYPPDAAQTVIALFAFWGWGLFVLALMALAVLARYRSATPLMFSIFLLEHLGRKLIVEFRPIVRSVAAPAWWINAALLTLMVVGLLLSLWQRSAPVDAAEQGI